MSAKRILILPEGGTVTGSEFLRYQPGSQSLMAVCAACLAIGDERVLFLTVEGPQKELCTIQKV